MQKDPSLPSPCTATSRCREPKGREGDQEEKKGEVKLGYDVSRRRSSPKIGAIDGAAVKFIASERKTTGSHSWDRRCHHCPCCFQGETLVEACPHCNPCFPYGFRCSTTCV
uniref:Uncharacterized protein n=1 Tax=Setaria viridis TaxID=4556 RepID=A0A4U6T4K3_SETVI|nr:hypothetical protein SEVIR_9G357850v2 [Setaria viridis]